MAGAEPPERGIALRAMAPNAVTLLALCFGLTGVRFAIGENWGAAVACVVIAGVLDGVDGRIARVAYKPGRFVSADLDKASEDNERHGLVIETETGQSVGVVQIAGLVARRIVCWRKEGDTLLAGERFGMIRFGSRLDVFLPEGSTVAVSPRQRAVGGETVLAFLPGANSAPPFPARAD